jgi:hypothetical protein
VVQVETLNVDVSSFRSHFEKIGKGASYIFPAGPVVKSAAFKYIKLGRI